jgi:hypothetical protein
VLGRQRAKNPEGVSVETLTLSGFPTRWNSKPRKVGLPVSTQSDLSVASGPIRGCPQAGNPTIRSTDRLRQAHRHCRFREPVEHFANHPHPHCAKVPYHRVRDAGAPASVWWPPATPVNPNAYLCRFLSGLLGFRSEALLASALFATSSAVAVSSPGICA